MADRRFSPLETARLADEVAERVRRSHERRLEELAQAVRDIEAAPRCIGFLMARMSASQNATAADDVIEFDVRMVRTNDLVSHNTDAYTFVLTPGYTYRLQAGAKGQDSGGFLRHRWYNTTAGEYIGREGLSVAPDRASPSSPLPVANAVLAPTGRVAVDVRVTDLDGTTEIDASVSWALVEVYQ